MKTARSNAQAEEVFVRADTVHLPGFLTIPPHAKGIVLFVHGSGSSRFSGRNQRVAEAVNANGFAALLFDLLTPDEREKDQITRELRFNIPLLAGRTMHAIDHVAAEPDLRDLRVGLFGASTGAAAALIAAAARPQTTSAVVSRGGRPDLAGDALRNVNVPVLLIVGGRDTQVIDLNRHAAAQLNVEHRTVVVPGASHLFEEPGKIEEVQRLAIDWFEQWLVPPMETEHE